MDQSVFVLCIPNACRMQAWTKVSLYYVSPMAALCRHGPNCLCIMYPKWLQDAGMDKSVFALCIPNGCRMQAWTKVSLYYVSPMAVGCRHGPNCLCIMYPQWLQDAGMDQTVFALCIPNGCRMQAWTKLSFSLTEATNLQFFLIPMASFIFLLCLRKHNDYQSLLQMTHCYPTHLQEKLQSAYQHFHSTDTALIKVTNHILMAIDQQKPENVMLLVLLYVSAAFDTVARAIYLPYFSKGYSKSLSKGTEVVPVIPVRQISSMSKQKTNPQDLPAVSGVPKGTTLGPYIFNIYKTSLADILRELGIKFHDYAVDHQLYLAF